MGIVTSERVGDESGRFAAPTRCVRALRGRR